jgi:hypothetical protein
VTLWPIACSRDANGGKGKPLLRAACGGSRASAGRWWRVGCAVRF